MFRRQTHISHVSESLGIGMIVEERSGLGLWCGRGRRILTIALLVGEGRWKRAGFTALYPESEGKSEGEGECSYRIGKCEFLIRSGCSR